MRHRAINGIVFLEPRECAYVSQRGSLLLSTRSETHQQSDRARSFPETTGRHGPKRQISCGSSCRADVRKGAACTCLSSPLRVELLSPVLDGPISPHKSEGYRQRIHQDAIPSTDTAPSMMCPICSLGPCVSPLRRRVAPSCHWDVCLPLSSSSPVSSQLTVSSLLWQDEGRT